jgi:hypothetical protein
MGESPAAGLSLGVEPIHELSMAFKRPGGIDHGTFAAAF